MGRALDPADDWKCKSRCKYIGKGRGDRSETCSTNKNKKAASKKKAAVSKKKAAASNNKKAAASKKKPAASNKKTAASKSTGKKTSTNYVQVDTEDDAKWFSRSTAGDVFGQEPVADKGAAPGDAVLGIYQHVHAQESDSAHDMLTTQ